MNEQRKLPLADAPKGQYSSTMYRRFKENCGGALDLYLKGTPEDTRIFQRGNTAHFVLKHSGRMKAVEPEQQKQIAQETVRKLCTEGYYYFERKQPPFDFESAVEGANVALKWLSQNSLPLNAEHDIVLAMDAQGNAYPTGAPDDKGWRWRAQVDCYWTKEDEVGEESILTLGVTSDFKSAWNANGDWLESPQCKSQIVLIWLHHPELDGVCAEIVNLRTGKTASKTIYFDNEGIPLLESWRDEILTLCDVMDKNREFQPGVGCVTCPYISHCKAAQEVKTARENAAALAVIERERDELKKIIRAQMGDTYDGIECNGGFIGYDLKQRTVLRPGAEAQIVAAWYRVPLDEAATMTHETSFVRALSLGSGNLENFIETILSDASETERKEFFELCATKEGRAEFGIHKNGHHAGLNLLPADTKLASLAPEPEKPTRTKVDKAKKIELPAKKRRVKKVKKTQRKKSGKKKVVARKMIKRAVMRKGKVNKDKATTKKLKSKSWRKGKKS